MLYEALVAHSQDVDESLVFSLVYRQDHVEGSALRAGFSVGIFACYA